MKPNYKTQLQRRRIYLSNESDDKLMQLAKKLNKSPSLVIEELLTKLPL